MNNQSITTLLQTGEIPIEKLADSAWRILWPLFAVGAFDKQNNNSASNNVRTPRNAEVAKNASIAGTVLLKNSNHLLPIRTATASTFGNASSGVKSIAVIGAQAARPIVTGGGSGAVSTRYVTSPLAGICKRLAIPVPSNALGRIMSASVGVDVVTIASAAELKTSLGAQVTTNPLLNLRSGSPHTKSSAALTTLFKRGVKVDALSFSYRYETGFHGNTTCGARFNVTIAGTTVYSSPLLTAYPYSHSKDPASYSPAVQVRVCGVGLCRTHLVPSCQPASACALYIAHLH
jgi:beta-glucosidase-like glycosyl hydrolase